MARVRFNTDRGELPPAARTFIGKFTTPQAEPAVRPRTVYGADISYDSTAGPRVRESEPIKPRPLMRRDIFGIDPRASG
jgi:hypothetical protein